MPAGMTYRQAARKAVAMCVSDFAAKGASPDSSVVSVGLKKGVRQELVDALARGFRDAEEEWGVLLVGGDTNEAKELVIDCAMVGFAERLVARGGAVPGVVFHTDQGSEYTAGSFRQACQRLGIAQSMGRPGSALDNAVIESWHSTLEFELRSLHSFATRAAARAAVAAWIEDYNHVRRHSALGMRSPVDYERSLAGKDAA